MLKCKKVLSLLLSVYNTSDWFRQQNSRKLCKAAIVYESLQQNLMNLNKTDIPCQEHEINVKFSSVGYCLQLL